MEDGVWRYIPCLEADGALQMAIDRWLFEAHLQGHHPPTLRFYTWRYPTLSLGYHQHSYPMHWHDLTYQGRSLDLVRRPTGGRAVLHRGDLTYALVRSRLPPSRSQAYREICQFLIAGWQTLSVPLTYGDTGRGYIHNPNCFGTATAADLLTPEGAKLIGSAQLRQGDRALQHGSIQLHPDPVLFQQVFGTLVTLPALPAHFKHETGRSQLITTLKTAAEQCFDIRLVEQPLSDEEWNAIQAQRGSFLVRQGE